MNATPTLASATMKADRPPGPMPSTLVEALAARAAGNPGAPAFEIVGENGAPSVHLTYADLADRAARVARRLHSAGAKPGSNAVLLSPAGEDFIASLFGAMWAGLHPAPVASSRTPVGLERIGRILSDCRPSVVLGSGAHLSRIAPRLNLEAGAAQPIWIPTDEKASAGRAPDPLALDPDQVAFIQYSSGSTADPKGVLISHRNALANLGYLLDAFRPGPYDVAVSWLPHHHDMGLVAGILFPIFAGVPGVLMSPTAFMRDPLSWLQVISDRRGTMSGGPNFGYDYCLGTGRELDPLGLDLSCWKVAITGAEPVRPETIDRFSSTFCPYGFDRRAFFPSYGLAEATLLVTGGDRFEGPRTIERLDAGRSTTLVSCGPPRTSVEVVDPEGLSPLATGQVGEVLIAGPSVTRGYWGQPQAASFVELAGRPGKSYLRTGDLGFMDDGDLFLCGRLKNLIIVRGRNLHAEDIETSARQADSALSAGGSAAFAIDTDDRESFVVLQELGFRAGDNEEPASLAAAVQHAVMHRHEARPAVCCILRPGALPRTSSGKVQRHKARMAFESGELVGVLAKC